MMYRNYVSLDYQFKYYNVVVTRKVINTELSEGLLSIGEDITTNLLYIWPFKYCCQQLVNCQNLSGNESAGLKILIARVVYRIWHRHPTVKVYIRLKICMHVLSDTAARSCK